MDAVAEQAVSIGFAVPADAPAYLDYLPGQYITLRASIGGDDVRQSYSIWTAPSRARVEGVIRIAAARVQGGRMSPWLAQQVGVGERIGVLPPMGQFVLDENDRPRLHAAIAGGSGITPVLAILAAALEQHPASRAVLVLANRTRASSVLRAELTALERACGGRLLVRDVLSREPGPHFGRVDEQLLTRMWPAADEVDDWWLCGPSGLNAAAQTWLASAGVDAAQVHHERFTSTGPVDEIPTDRSRAASAHR